MVFNCIGRTCPLKDGPHNLYKQIISQRVVWSMIGSIYRKTEKSRKKKNQKHMQCLNKKNIHRLTNTIIEFLCSLCCSRKLTFVSAISCFMSMSLFLSICTADKQKTKESTTECTLSEFSNEPELKSFILLRSPFSVHSIHTFCVCAHTHAHVQTLHGNLRIDIVCGKCTTICYECVAGMLFFFFMYSIYATHTYQYFSLGCYRVASMCMCVIWRMCDNTFVK